MIRILKAREVRKGDFVNVWGVMKSEVTKIEYINQSILIYIDGLYELCNEDNFSYNIYDDKNIDGNIEIYREESNLLFDFKKIKSLKHINRMGLINN